MSQKSTESTETKSLNVPGISFSTFLLKLIAGGVGGSAGSLILILIFVLASSVLTPITNFQTGADQFVSPIFTFILLMMVFLSSTAGNILSVWLLSLTEKEKYNKVSSTIYQIFILSIVIFVLMVPVYFLTAASDISITAYAIALHIMLSAQVSALILEIVSNYRYSLVGVYGLTFGVLVASGVMFGLAGIVPSPQILLFAALPVVWLSIALMQSLFTMIYGWIANTYDKDFLSADNLYGDDYGKDEDLSEEEKAPKAQDEEGADFLRHN